MIELHRTAPNESNDPIEIEVHHHKYIQEVHTLEGVCSTCGEEIKTTDPQAVMVYEQGHQINGSCACGQKFTAAGRSKLVKPKDVGRVVVPGVVNNRHARRRIKPC
jgi:hypothetical protein